MKKFILALVIVFVLLLTLVWAELQTLPTPLYDCGHYGLSVVIHPEGAGEVRSDDFYPFYNPSPGFPLLHHEAAVFDVVPVAADGYQFSHWQISQRRAKGDWITITTQAPEQTISVMLGGKAVVTYCVAFFVETGGGEQGPVDDDPGDHEVSGPDDPGGGYAREDIINDLETIIKKIRVNQ